jgi:hypothetical protein
LQQTLHKLDFAAAGTWEDELPQATAPVLGIRLETRCVDVGEQAHVTL